VPKDYHKNRAVLFVLILVGILTGSVIGEALGGTLPFLSKSVEAGFPPVALQLADAMKLTVGFNLKFNLATVLGVVAAIFAYRSL
jgi:hypothetical protein